MKNLIKITLFTLTSLLSFGAYSQACQASFTYTSGTLPGEIIFTDNSTNYPSLGNYSNGLILTTTLLGTNPPFSPYSASQNLNGFITSAGGSKNMVFQYNDTYIVKYYLSNNSGCSSQFNDTIIISSIPTNIPCTAGLNITPGTNSGEFVITDNSVGEDFGIFYNWNNVNQTLTPSNSSANIQYSANGSYFYKYAIFDTIVGCYDSITGNINVNSFPCQATSNIYTNPGSGNIFLQNTSTYAHINTLSTPGATVPSQTNGPYQNFYVNYTSNGTYPYTLIILDTISGCTDTLIDSIVVSSFPQPCNIQAGLTITAGSNPGQYIFTDNSSGGTTSYFYPGTGTGSLNILPNPSTNYTYAANGTYNYYYIVSSSNCHDTLLGTLVVTGIAPPQPCTIQPAISITNGSNPGEYNLTDNSIGGNFSFFQSGFLPTVYVLPNTTATITYPANGIYNYKYKVLDTNSNCIDSVTGTINVTGISNPCNIQAGLTITAGSNPGQFIFTDNSTGGSSSYLNPGLGLAGLSILPNPSATYTYTTNGTYNYIYVISDTNSTCLDTLMGTITVTGIITTTPCSADFLLLQDSLNPSQYYCWNTSTGSSPAAVLTYSWDFGDGNTSNLAYPTHTYNSLGIFTLCLTITEAGSTCTSTHCDSIIVSVKASGTTLNVLPAGTNLGIAEQKLINEVSLYPNPSNGKFTIELVATNSSEIVIAIVNLAGQILYKETRGIISGNNKLNIADNELAVGTYFVSISNRKSGEAKTLKLVKN